MVFLTLVPMILILIVKESLHNLVVSVPKELIDECVLCEAEKASFTKISPKSDSFFEKPGSLSSSPAWKRRFSRSSISPLFHHINI